MHSHFRLFALACVAAVLSIVLPGRAQASVRGDPGPTLTVLVDGQTDGHRAQRPVPGLTVDSSDQGIILAVPMTSVSAAIGSGGDVTYAAYVDLTGSRDARILVPRAGLSLPTPDAKPSSGTVRAMLELYGIARPVDLSWTAARTSSGWLVIGDFPVDLQSYGIQVSSALGEEWAEGVMAITTFALSADRAEAPALNMLASPYLP